MGIRRHDIYSLLTFIIIHIIGGNSGSLYANTRIYGSVSDSITHEAMPYVSVYLQNTTDGCQTDKAGKFSFLSSEKNAVLIVSSIGYKEKHISITSQTRYPLHIKLTPVVYELNEVEIKPERERYRRKGNPAVELVQSLIKKRQSLRLDNHSYYNRNRHELLTIALNNFDQSKYQAELLENIGLLQNYLDTSLVSGKPILNISSRELIGSDHYCQSPENLKKYVVARRRAGVDDFISEQEIDGVFEEVFKDVDIFQNDINLFRNRFASPLSTIGPNIYKYYIMDTIQVEGIPCIDLAFAPFNSESHGFTGHLYITTDSTHFIKWVQMTTPHDINLNFVRTLNITQTFSPASDGTPLLDKETMTAEFEITAQINGVYVKREVNYKNYLLDVAARPDLFDHPETIIEEEGARNRSEEFWESHRIGHVSEKERSISDMITQLRQYPLYYWTEKIITYLFTGYVPNKKTEPEFFYGPLNTSISNNALEGLRLRVGGMTSAYLNPHLMGRFFVAYGFRDQRLKYMGELEYSFEKKKEHINEFPIHSLRLHYENDIYQYGQTYLYTNKDNIFLNLKRMEDNQIGYLRKAEFSYNREHYNHLSYSLTLRNKVYESSRLMQFETRNEGIAHFAPELPQTELELSLRYAPGEKFTQKKWDRNSLLPERPVFTLSHSVALKDVLGSQFTCHHTEASARKRFWLSSFGYIDAVVKGGRVWNDVPYPLLIIPNANLSYTLQKESFALMNPMEFVADTYASWETIYYMNGLIFNRLPLIKKLGWREVIDFKGFYGSLRPGNKPDLMNSNGLYLFPLDPEYKNPLTHMPYMELSFGIENIFKILEVDYVRRLTYNELPGISKHGVRIRVHVQF
ncbi:MAG: carboxypeptidase-like regulatory domain-containing protein [Bacteroidaceae bacterium]|nr:carboxypeptidase-like regulatory domain-containing protein [Bacteroidaceae bacterium]